MKTTTAEQLLNKVRNDYNQIAEDFSHTRVYPWADFDIFLEYLQDEQNILDIGCGNGRLNESLKKKKLYYNGVDNSGNLIMRAQRKYPQQFFQVGDILKLPFVKEEFDAALAVAVLHHIPSAKLRRAALKEISRVLKPNGYLLMTNWNLWQNKYRHLIWLHLLKKIFHLNDFDKGDVLVPWKSPKGKIIQQRYYHAFTTNELSTLAENSGFKIIKQYYSYKGKKTDQKKALNILSIWQKA